MLLLNQHLWKIWKRDNSFLRRLLNNTYGKKYNKKKFNIIHNYDVIVRNNIYYGSVRLVLF